MSKSTTHATIILLLIQELRVERRITQKKIADALGVTTSAYNKIENGSTQLPLDKLYIICTELKTFPSTVLDQAEKIATVMTHRGWQFSHRCDKDDLEEAMKTNKDFGLNSFTMEYGFVKIPYLIRQLIA